MAFRARFVKNIIHFASQRGASKQDLLHPLDCSTLEGLDDEALFFDQEQYDDVLQIALAQTADPLLGLHLGSYLSLSAAGLILQIIQTSRTVQEALEYAVAFANLGCQELPFTLRELDHAWELALNPRPSWIARYPISAQQTIDGMMVFTIREFQSITLRKHQPLSVHFSYAHPGALAHYQSLFQCPVHIGSTRTALYLKKEQVADEVNSADYQLLGILVRYAENKLARMEETSDFGNRVRKTILHMAQPQFPGIEAAAGNLHVSVRTLQRRLEEEGLSYQVITDELRQQLAMDYLRNRNLTVKEIAYSLDFSEASSFIRTFKRWFGTSPQRYREQYLWQS